MEPVVLQMIKSLPVTCIRLVSQATPFAERGRVWSRYNRRVVATTETCQDQSNPRSLWIASVVMEYNYVTTCLADVSILFLGDNSVSSSLVPRHQIFRARPVALSKNRVWTRSLVYERSGMLSHQSDCSGKVNCVMCHHK